ncbi:MAG: hypothetical protein B7Z43_11105 [Sphingomonas sp. 12-62-6]|nr:MAG: hypothetical protein B7Z43_11105 [Sphingomonas sp. 12-62-6]
MARDWWQQTNLPLRRLPVLDDWRNFGGSESRVAAGPGGSPLLLSEWSQPLSDVPSVRQRLRNLLQDLTDDDIPLVSAHSPIVLGDKVAFRDLRSVRVVELATGNTLWQTAEGVSPERILNGVSAESLNDESAWRVRVNAQSFDQEYQGPDRLLTAHAAVPRFLDATARPLTGTTNYTLDALYRLTQVDAPDAANDEAFSYDRLGNRLIHTRGSATVGASGAGIVSKYSIYTAATQTGSVSGYMPVYNHRLKEIRIGSATGAIDSSFAFDPEGRLTGQTGSNARTLITKFRKRTAYMKVINRYIFPGGELDYIGMTTTDLERHGFEVRDVESMREHYYLSLKAWSENLYANREAAIAEAGLTRTRLWLLYFALSCTGFYRGVLCDFQTLAQKRQAGLSGLPFDRRTI